MQRGGLTIRARNRAVATAGFISNSVEPRMIKEGKTRLGTSDAVRVCSWAIANVPRGRREGGREERRFRQMRSGESVGRSARRRARGRRRTTNGNGRKRAKGRRKREIEKSPRSRRLPSSRVIGVGEVDGDSSPAAAPLLNLLPSRRAVYSTSSLFQVDSIIFPFWRAFEAARAALDRRQGDFHARRATRWRVINAILIPPPASARLGILNRRFASGARRASSDQRSLAAPGFICHLKSTRYRSANFRLPQLAEVIAIPRHYFRTRICASERVKLTPSPRELYVYAIYHLQNSLGICTSVL